MKLTRAWLGEHLQSDLPLKTLTARLSMLGLEVDAVRDQGEGLREVRVARIVSVAPHPDADKLQVCKVEAGGAETLQVVCGAPNARTGLVTALAPVGATLPGGFAIKEAEIRGVASSGMLCSASELGLSEAHDGIVELDSNANIGESLTRLLGLDDPLIEIDLTPNRADCLGVRGIARDLAAAGLGELRPLALEPVPGDGQTPRQVRLALPEAAADACPIFAARLIRGVANGPSPAWLQARLRAVGLRPISALVDITNFFTLDRARPLHVFDADRLQGDLVVRLATAGETLEALDGHTYTLDEGMTVIADDAGVQSLGGVIGGAATGVDDATVNVLLECAHFDPVRTAITGRRLRVHSDARHRFERGVDPASARDGVEAATRMILELCGGQACDVFIAGAEPTWRRALRLRPWRVAALGGLEVPVDEQRALLEALGCEVADDADGALVVTPPSWRADIEGEADLVEEVLRVKGYDAIEAVDLPRAEALPSPALTPAQRRVGDARRALAARGLMETITFSFMDSEVAARFTEVQETLRLVNPISVNLDLMRPTIVPNLLQAVGRNQDRDLDAVALFEVGPQFADDTPRGQRTFATGLRAGVGAPRHWLTRARPVDVHDARADAMAALEACGFDASRVQLVAEAPSYYHPGRSARLQLGPRLVLGHVGELHPGLLQQLGVRGPVVGFELDLDAIPQPRPRGSQARPPFTPSPFQAVVRDFAFILDRDVAAADVTRAAASADRQLIDAIQIFDVYEGERVPKGKKSLAFSVRFQPRDRTLTDEEIDAASKKLIAQVVKATGGELRA